MQKVFSIYKKLKIWQKSFVLIFSVFVVWYAFSLPNKLFEDKYATVVLDRNEQLLGAKIADDGQWRFPQCDSVPSKLGICIVQFEDKTFYNHLGISLKGITRAIIQNYKRKKIVSGASTISMQTIRLIRKNPSRTFFEKIYEMILATRLEISRSKNEILRLYISHAPFGNNVVGLNAASWRYFGKSSNKLSWAESATLAVLPNAPGLIYPGKNHQRLLSKRNALLLNLFQKGIIDTPTYELSITEHLPDKPLPLPQYAPHLLQKFYKTGMKGKIIHSTIDLQIQLQVINSLQSHQLSLQDNKIYNGAILITSVKTGEILAYVGNTNDSKEHSNDVNCIDAPRSTGSILKPILYEKCLESGLITPNSLLQDIPVQYGNFSPKNYNKTYDGAVAANQALARSLNIPLIKLLNDYGLSKFHYDLKNLGLNNLKKGSNYYGLSLILGGAEISLWELNSLYSNMAMKASDIKGNGIILLRNEKKSVKAFNMNKACIYSTLNAMTELNRPDEEGNWKAFESSKKIAWKTGTSFGNRDAWCIGVTPEFVVSVWIGNADGEGRTGLTGLNCAAPVLFDLFSNLKTKQSWFNEPYDGFKELEICKESGYRATEYCRNMVVLKLPSTCVNVGACPYHKSIFVNKNNGLRVDADCEVRENMIAKNYFILPPLVEKYYVLKHPEYVKLPLFNKDCLSKINDKAMMVVYPKPNSKIIVPHEMDGAKGKVICEVSHKNANIKLYWHLDEEYIGETFQIHQMVICPQLGKHILTLVDENGITIKTQFEIIGKEE